MLDLSKFTSVFITNFFNYFKLILLKNKDKVKMFSFLGIYLQILQLIL